MGKRQAVIAALGGTDDEILWTLIKLAAAELDERRDPAGDTSV